MTEEERQLYHDIRNVDVEKILTAAKAAMAAESHKLFHAQIEANKAAVARVGPIHDAMRAALSSNPDFEPVMKALQSSRKALRRKALPPPAMPPAPKTHRLKLGSIHLVDTPPFQAQTWSATSITGGDTSDNGVGGLSADGSGNMSFQIAGGGMGDDNASTVSCWSAVGQVYTVPANVGSSPMMRFSATPSFNWNAIWGSDWWRLASGNIWIGQAVNRFDSNGVFIDNPVSYQTTLESWSDHNFADSQDQSGQNTAYGLSTGLMVEPQFIYGGWVWIGATAFGDTVDSGWSSSFAQMTANVPSLIFDTF